jgi:hypothetical protein
VTPSSEGNRQANSDSPAVAMSDWGEGGGVKQQRWLEAVAESGACGRWHGVARLELGGISHRR